MLRIPGKYLFLSMLTLQSCRGNRLNEVVVKDDNIEVSWYQDSEITSVHDIVEAHNGSSSLIVIEAATGAVGIAEILIKHDTILIKSMPLYLYKKDGPGI